MTGLPAPARVTVTLARRANVGIIFCHGPRTTVRMIRWDTHQDVFEPGQWLTGQLHDWSLSPDGEKLAYSASKFPCSERKRYVAISKPPYFTALAYWPRESGWGECTFQSNDRLRISYWTESMPPTLPDDNLERWLKVERCSSRTTESDPNVDDGWERVGVAPHCPPGFVGSYGADLSARTWSDWVKPSPDGRGELRRGPASASPRGKARLTPNFAYRYVGARGNSTDLLRDATWADWDRRGRLVLAREGKLFAADLRAPDSDPKELADFNAMRSEPIKPPMWATRWLAKLGRRGR